MVLRETNVTKTFNLSFTIAGVTTDDVNEKIDRIMDFLKKVIEEKPEESEGQEFTGNPIDSVDEDQSRVEGFFGTEIKNMGFSERLGNALKKAGINNGEDLYRCSAASGLMDIENVGEKSVQEIQAKLKEMGLI